MAIREDDFKINISRELGALAAHFQHITKNIEDISAIQKNSAEQRAKLQEEIIITKKENMDKIVQLQEDFNHGMLKLLDVTNATAVATASNAATLKILKLLTFAFFGLSFTTILGFMAKVVFGIDLSLGDN